MNEKEIPYSTRLPAKLVAQMKRLLKARGMSAKYWLARVIADAVERESK